MKTIDFICRYLFFLFLALFAPTLSYAQLEIKSEVSRPSASVSEYTRYGKYDPANTLPSGGEIMNNQDITSIVPVWKVFDHLGSVRVVLDRNANILQQNDYYPFGLRTDSGRLYKNDGESNRLKFNGKEQQSGLIGLNLIDYGARFYDPTLIRWTTQDPMAEKYMNVSAYVYCHENPINRIDVDGRTDYYTQNGSFVKRIDDGKNIKIMLFITSKKESKVNDAIENQTYIIVPSNEVVNTMERAYKLTEKDGNEHGFRVGKKGNISIIVKGDVRSIDESAWLPAIDDLRDKGDYVAYDVHTHPKPKYDGGTEVPFNNLP